MERDDQRVDVVSGNVPVECRQGVKPQARLEAGDGSQCEIVWCNPGKPVEERQGRDDMVRKPEPDEHTGKCEQEEVVAGHAVQSFEGAGDCRTFVCKLLTAAWGHWELSRPTIMKRLVQGHGDKRTRPDAERWIDQESSSQPSKPKAHQIEGKLYS